jgi:hypothetical protein
MTLSYVRPIGPTEVREIARIRNDVYRNRWITYGYHDISQRMRTFVGDDNASWCTFSTWSSRTVGDNLRVDELHPAGERWLREHHVRFPPTKWVVRKLGFWIRRRRGAAMPHVLALGNRLVFSEIGLAYTQFLEAFEAASAPDTDAWAAFERTIEPLPATPLFTEGDVRQLREGLGCYYRARWEPEGSKSRAELVLRGNLLLGVYEQTRLQPLVEAAASPFSYRLLHIGEGRRDRLTGVVGPDEITLSRAERPWALRHRSWWRRWLARRYAMLLTRRVLFLELPKDGGTEPEVLHMSEGLPQPPGTPLYPPLLESLTDPATLTLFQRYADPKGDGGGCRVRNWVLFDERMDYIVNLFRARQQTHALYRALPELDRMAVRLVIGPTDLDDLRQIGDPEADGVVKRYCEESRREPTAFLRELVQRVEPEGATAQILGDYRDANPALPPWAKEDKMRRGQELFREFSLEVAASLFAASLPMSYTAAKGARVLTTTGDLVSRPHRRLAETGQMLLDVMAAEPDDQDRPPLAPDTHGYRAARGVRLFHAAVRRSLTKDPEVGWDECRLGVPINQEDLLGTLLVFTVCVVQSLEKLGIPFRKKKDWEAYVHFWLVLGSLLGVDYELLCADGTVPADEDPLTYDELELLAEEILLRNAERSDAGELLTGALLGLEQQAMPWGFKGMPRAMVRRLIGPRYSDLLGVPRAGSSRLLLDALRPVAWVASYFRPVDGLGRLTGWANKRLYAWFITSGEGEHPAWRGRAVLETWKLRPAVLAAASAPDGVQQGVSAPLQEPGAVGDRDAASGVEEVIDLRSSTDHVDVDEQARPLEPGLGEEEGGTGPFVGGDRSPEERLGSGDVTGGGGEHAEEVRADRLGHSGAGEDVGEGGDQLP